MQNEFECYGVELPRHKLIIICMYRIPDCKKSNPYIFLKRFEILLDKLRLKAAKKKIVIAGDFNINVLKKDSITTEFYRILNCYDYTAHVKEPTRLTACIDNILSKIPESSAEKYDLYLSDHENAQMLSITTDRVIKKKFWY